MIAEATKCFVPRLWFLGLHSRLLDEDEFIILELLSVFSLDFLFPSEKLFALSHRCDGQSRRRRAYGCSHLEFLFLCWTMLSLGHPSSPSTSPLYLLLLLTLKRMIVAAGPLRVDLVAYQIGALLQTLGDFNSSERVRPKENDPLIPSA